MNAAYWIKLATVSGFLAVALGAFGAHGLRSWLKSDLDRELQLSLQASEDTGSTSTSAVRKLAASRRLDVFDTGVKYHFWHTLALLGLGLLMLHSGQRGLEELISGLGFSLGILIFSGSLYGLALTGIPLLGFLPVFGGVAFLMGWLGLFLSAGKL